jgi:hypothetical protein
MYPANGHTQKYMCINTSHIYIVIRREFRYSVTGDFDQNFPQTAAEIGKAFSVGEGGYWGNGGRGRRDGVAVRSERGQYG